ncbi:P-loop containing nucleoside triphosphate hydrolase protein [Mycena floridula]|nr:P-loop containing nucleoside triphosphate hydrolase protein [Mycena floridula]
MRTFFQIHLDRPAGDVLIFLPSQEDIESLEKSIYFFANQLPTDSMRVDICPMYASQAPRKNSRVFAPAAAKTRKCILATNIAETSITIPGVKYVIDTGKCKEKRYLAGATNAFETLLLADITQSSAMQRTGRAGREGMGYCFRLYTEKAFKAMDVSPEPEIRRCNLTASFLELKLTGQDLQELDLMDKPEEDTIGAALRTLLMLGALSQNKELTETGRQMASFPLEPIYSRVVIASKDYKCTSEVITIISVLSASSKLYFDNSDDRETVSESRRKFRHSTGDHLTILNVVRAYEDIKASESKEGRRTWCRSHFLNERTLLEAAEIKAQLEMTCRRKGIDPTVSCGESDEPVLRSLVQGLFTNSAFLQKDGSYKQTVGQSTVKIHPGSVLIEKKVPAIIYDELVSRPNPPDFILILASDVHFRYLCERRLVGPQNLLERGSRV